MNDNELQELLSELSAQSPEVIWNPSQPGETVAGQIEDVVDGSPGAPGAVIIRTNDNHLVRVNLRAKNLRDWFEEFNPQPGDLAAIKYTGTGVNPETNQRYKTYTAINRPKKG